MAAAPSVFPGDIIHLNVGGTRYSTSRQTLTWVPDTFFTSMLSGRISTLKDENGAIFIDRDPSAFGVILNFLRTKQFDVSNLDLATIKSEAEFYGITTLVKRLGLCEDLNHSSCGNVLFHGYIVPPAIPVQDLPPTPMPSRSSTVADFAEVRPGTVMRVGDAARTAHFASMDARGAGHVRGASADLRPAPRLPTHSRTSSVDLRHSRTSSTDLGYRACRPDTGATTAGYSSGGMTDANKVCILAGSHNWIAVAYSHFICLYRMKESVGWHLCATSPHMESTIERLALNAKVLAPNQIDHKDKMLAVSYGNLIRLWSVSSSQDLINLSEVGTFNLTVHVDELFFIGSQLVAISQLGKVGVWHAMSQHWQIQDVVPITSYDTAGSFLLLGCSNGSIYYIDMQKFPLRMKDNDLLVTELYKDPGGDMVTALSVYLTPKTSISGNWIEIAYGTSSGTVRVIVQHPETVGHGPQLFQTFTVHRSPVTKVMLSEKHLVSVCLEYNHVRTWSVTRFRGMISTQPGSTPLASFKIVSLEDVDPHVSYTTGNDYGPYGVQDEDQVFVQKVVPETDQLFVRLSSTGKRVCMIKSVDGSTISSFCVHECEGSSRMGSRPRRYLFTGHVNGAIQMWDITTALELCNKPEKKEEAEGVGGPTEQELLRMMEHCDCTGSLNSTPSFSPSPSLLLCGFPHGGARLKASNLAFLLQASQTEAPESLKATTC